MKSLFLMLMGLAYGSLVHAAPPEPRAAAAHVDHLILGARDLDEGIRRLEEQTGVRPKVGGEHPGRGTRNALVSLGKSLYIEILAPQVNAPIRAWSPSCASARTSLRAAGPSRARRGGRAHSGSATPVGLSEVSRIARVRTGRS
jgi:hypothetical protein